MRVVRVLIAVMTAIALGGCGTFEGMKKDLGTIVSSRPSAPVVVHAPPASSSAQAHAYKTCDRPQQRGCLDFRIIGLKHDASNPLMQAVEKPWRNQAERADRVEHLPLRLHEAWVEGTAQYAGDRTYLVYVYRAALVTTDVLTSWRTSRDGTYVRGTVEWVQNPPRAPKDPSGRLGAPQVFRIASKGGNVSLQLPMNALTRDTEVLVCVETGQSVYPRAENGLWTTSAYLNGPVRQHGWSALQMAATFQ